MPNCGKLKFNERQQHNDCAPNRVKRRAFLCPTFQKRNRKPMLFKQIQYTTKKCPDARTMARIVKSKDLASMTTRITRQQSLEVQKKQNQRSPELVQHLTQTYQRHIWRKQTTSGANKQHLVQTTQHLAQMNQQRSKWRYIWRNENKMLCNQNGSRHRNEWRCDHSCEFDQWCALEKICRWRKKWLAQCWTNAKDPHQLWNMHFFNATRQEHMRFEDTAKKRIACPNDWACMN